MRMDVTSAIVFLLIGLTSVSCSKSAAQKQLEKFSATSEYFSSYESICADSTADRSFSVRSKAQCIHECQHGGERSTCVGVNYRQDANVCDVYNQCPTSYNFNNSGCQYLQRVMTASKKNCSIHTDCGKTSGKELHPSFADTVLGSQPVNAMVSFDNQLFVTRMPAASDHIAVYNATDNQFLRNITIPGATDYLYGLAVGSGNNILYVSEYRAAVVHRVNLTSTLSGNLAITQWPVSCTPSGLSVNRAKNVLVTCMSGQVIEYNTNGYFVRQLTTSGSPWHSIEVGNGVLAVSRNSMHKVCLMAINGTVLKCYGTGTAGSGPGQLNNPRTMASDKQGYLLVADTDNNRLLVLNPTLSDARLLPLPYNETGSIIKPRGIWLDESRGRLYVGELGGKFRVLVFDNVFNLETAFVAC